MVDQLMLQTLSIIVSSVGMIIALTYYALTIRNQTKSRQTQIFMQLHEEKYDREGLEAFFDLQNWHWEDYDDYQKKYGPYTHPELAAIMESQTSYFEGLGILVQDGMVDINIVYRIAGRRINQLWYQFEAVIKEIRKMARGPGSDYAESFEYLATEVIKLRRQNGLQLFEDRIHPTSTLYQERT